MSKRPNACLFLSMLWARLGKSELAAKPESPCLGLNRLLPAVLCIQVEHKSADAPFFMDYRS